jgi:hypothetical protein
MDKQFLYDPKVRKINHPDPFGVKVLANRYYNQFKDYGWVSQSSLGVSKTQAV